MNRNPSGKCLTLDTLGVWLPDLTTREKLRRGSLRPSASLEAMVKGRSTIDSGAAGSASSDL